MSNLSLYVFKTAPPKNLKYTLVYLIVLFSRTLTLGAATKSIWTASWAHWGVKSFFTKGFSRGNDLCDILYSTKYDWIPRWRTQDRRKNFHDLQGSEGSFSVFIDAVQNWFIYESSQKTNSDATQTHQWQIGHNWCWKCVRYGATHRKGLQKPPTGRLVGTPWTTPTTLHAWTWHTHLLEIIETSNNKVIKW